MKPSALAAAFDAVRRMFPAGRARLAVDGSPVALVDVLPAPAAMKVFDGAVYAVPHDTGVDSIAPCVSCMWCARVSAPM
ncbi:hypothetical protein [Nocardia brasiliensis]|uniref:hypothetical protein n=1 Tax=Nocardia brasiliensis TaxID=37326 RepID=UPI0004A6D757|nr:hypothetical protein [Nocardia brasiliensis]